MLEENRPEPARCIRADTAYRHDEPPARRGEARHRRAGRGLDWPLGGKTGTTDDFTDAWFIGFDPDITVGVWVGSIRRSRSGADETGAAAALPIWIDFMRGWIARKEDRANCRNSPPGQHRLRCRARYRRARDPRRADSIEVFISGTQPGGEDRWSFAPDLASVALASRLRPPAGRASRTPFFIRYVLMNASMSPSRTRFDVADLLLRAVVLDHLVRVQHVAADLAAEGDVLLLAAQLIELRLLLLRRSCRRAAPSAPSSRHRDSCAASARSGTTPRCRSADA